MPNQSGETLAVYNPATGKQIYSAEVADESVMGAALQSAEAGFKVWSALPAVERGRILMKAVQLLRERNDELARIEVLDTGKPWQEASTVDVVTGADSI